MSQEEDRRPQGDLKDEEALLCRLRAGDESAFEALVEQQQRPLFSLLARLTGNPEEAMDLVQETFLRAVRGLASFRGESSLRTWLHRIAVNVFLNERRTARPEMVELETIENLAPSWWDRWSGRVPDPEQLASSREGVERLGRAMARLPEEHRAVLLLRDREVYSAKEVASLLEITVPAVKSRLHRARVFVRQELLGPSGRGS